MCAKSADDGFDLVVERLRAAQSLLVIAHARPDGDALGSMVGLVRASRSAGKSAHMLLPDSLPDHYRFLFPEEVPAPASQFPTLRDRSDVVVILDTRAFAQLDGLERQLRQSRGSLIVIDHHETGDDLTDAQWVDASASSVGVMMGELLNALGWAVDLQCAEALVTAIVSDTGWLRFANTDSRSLRAVTRWVAAGVRMDALYRKLYQSDRPERLALLERVLRGLELHCGGKLAIMTLRQKDFSETGAKPMETENMVNEALRIGSVEVAAMLVENDERVRISIRSRDTIDVAQIASQFGGGGHRRAAGARSTDQLDTVKQHLVDISTEQFDRAEN